jgi:hypothetical protein
LLRGWRKNNEPPQLEPMDVRFNAESNGGASPPTRTPC